MWSGNYNFLNRSVESSNVLDIAPVGHLDDAALLVFAAGAQKGEGNLIVNGELYENVWNGSSNSVEEYMVDLSDSLAESSC